MQTSNIWTKLYITTAAVFVFILGFIVYYSSSWLHSITDPVDAYAGYEYFRKLGWYVLWITAAILLFLANLLLIWLKRPWALLATFIYFTVFVLGLGFLLPISSIGFLKDHGFATETSAYLSPFMAIALCVGAAALIYLNLLVFRRFNQTDEATSMEGEGDSEDEILVDPDVESSEQKEKAT